MSPVSVHSVGCCPAVTVALSAVYLLGFVASHPLAKKVGAWSSVLSVTAGSAGAS